MASGKLRKQIVQHEPGLFILYNDGSFHRPTHLDVPACPRFVNGVASMDIFLNSSSRLWARIFFPQQHRDQEPTMPLVLHFHSGGFCFGSPSGRRFHDYCSRMAVQSRCIWISVAYRLAPEHPLPAAYDDAYEALLWLRAQASAAPGVDSTSGAVPWLAEHANFSKCFLAGDSAGGNIVHFLAVRAAANDWRPVRIRGLLVMHAAFTQKIAKKAGAEWPKLPPKIDFYHRSMLPGGAPVDHPYLNPLHSDWPKFSEIQLPPLVVAVAGRDPLKAGSEQYYEELKKAGKDVQLFVSDNEDHCFHLSPSSSKSAELLENNMIQFITQF